MPPWRNGYGARLGTETLIVRDPSEQRCGVLVVLVVYYRVQGSGPGPKRRDGEGVRPRARGRDSEREGGRGREAERARGREGERQRARR